MTSVTSGSGYSGRLAARNVTAGIVLSVLFVSLIVIYLVTPDQRLALQIAVVILAIALPVALYGEWRSLATLAILAGFVSVAAAALLGNARFGIVGGVLLALLWLLGLFLIFRSLRNNVLIVPRDRVYLVLNNFTGEVSQVRGPIAPPPIPGVETLVAALPLYDLNDDHKIDKVNTVSGQNIDEIQVHVRYRVDPDRSALVYTGIPNRGEYQAEVAKEMGKQEHLAPLDVNFWEQLLHRLMNEELDDIVRHVVFNQTEIKRPIQAYAQRELLASQVRSELDVYVSRRGIIVNELRLEFLGVPEEKFRNPYDVDQLARESGLERVKAEREATRLRELLAAAAEVEKQRLQQIIEALHRAEVEVTPDVLKDAIRAASDWVIEGEYTLMQPEPPKPAGGDKKDSKDGKK